uniref:Uncharacterized protein n=1 Tax=Lactuca sativa TaxID=4236 RepID=A0A9R1XVE9_LACSA|nr:hypothetical protein LSAT_V11C200065070 [Lactuca sativa]
MTLSSFGTVSAPTYVSHVGLDGRLYIEVRDKEADINGYSWATLSDETKLLYWEEFHKKLWGHDPAHHELFLYTHTKNHDGLTFLVDKAKKIHDDVMERCDRLEAIGEEIDEDKLFYDVVGGHDQKKRLYGFGSYGKRIRSSKGSSETHCKQYGDNNVETKVEIENLKTLVETQREQYEDIQQKYEDVQQKYEDAQKKNVEFQ